MQNNMTTKDYARTKAAKYRTWAESAEQQAHQLYTQFQEVYGRFDWTQPILRGHHSQKAHQRVYARRDTMHTKVHLLVEKAKSHRQKAENLECFANTNKGDAERAREVRRVANDAVIMVGSNVFDFAFRDGVVLKVNKKTYTIQFKTFVTTRDKSWVKLSD
jgi:hypothetical protein